MRNKRKPEPLGKLTKPQIQTYKKILKQKKEYQELMGMFDTLAQQVYLAREHMIGLTRMFHADVLRSLELEPCLFRVDPETWNVVPARQLHYDEYGNELVETSPEPSDDAVLSAIRSEVYDAAMSAVEDYLQPRSGEENEKNETSEVLSNRGLLFVEEDDDPDDAA